MAAPDRVEPANVGELVATARDTGLLTMPELKLLQALEEPVTRAQPEDRANAVRGVVAGQVAEYSALFVKLIAVYQKPPLQVLALSLAHACAVDMGPSDLDIRPQVVTGMLAAIPVTEGLSPPLVRMFVSPFVDVSRLAILVGAALARQLAASPPRPAAAEHVEALIAACVAHAAAQASERHHEAACAGANLLAAEASTRALVLGKRLAAAVVPLVARYPPNVQLTYEAGRCLWLCTFDGPAALSALADAGAIKALHGVLCTYKKEKCLRVALFALRGFVAAGEQRYVTEVAHMYRQLCLLAQTSFGDEDIKKVVDDLCADVKRVIDDVSSYAEWKREVLSGRLEWSPVHTSAKFWAESIRRFDDDGFTVLRALTQLLKESDDPTTLHIALSDVGEFVRHHPAGRKVLTSFDGVKARVLQLMEDARPEVARAALACTQKIMVQRWEYLDSRE